MQKQCLLLVLLIILHFQYPVKAQNKTSQANELIEALLEGWLNEDESAPDPEMLYDELNTMLENPVNLNTASDEELSSLIILNDFQIASLKQYISEQGPLVSVYEIPLIYGFNMELTKKIIPFVTIGPDKSSAQKKRKLFAYGNHQILVRYERLLESRRGYESVDDSVLLLSPGSYYTGSPGKFYLRYDARFNNRLFWGITGEKDAGEPFLKSPNQYGFDFYSFHFLLKNPGILKTIALGDYQIRYGQGLTLQSGFGFSKSTMPLNISKHREGIRKYGSANENSFFRGAALSLQYKLISISMFYSRKKVDAHQIATDTTDHTESYAVSLPVSGLHRTLTELSYKNKVIETTTGYHIALNTKNLQLGHTMCYYQLNVPLVSRSSQTPGLNSFANNSAVNAGIDYRYSWKNISIFGEGAMNKMHSLALLNGVLINLNTQLSVSFLYRNYQENYSAPYGNAFAEGSSPVNEEGFYTGFVLYPFHHWKISGYFDNFRFPWVKFRTDSPSAGYDYFVQADFNPDANTSMYWRFKKEKKQENNSDTESGINPLSERTLSRFRYNIKYTTDARLSGGSRIEMVWYSKGGTNKETGYMACQDVHYTCNKFPVDIMGRVAVFDTDGYNSRIYTYENDVLYAFSIPAFQDKGMRTYLLVKISPLKSVDMWVKLSQTWYSNKNEIGSGPAAIMGSSKSEIKVEMKVKL